MERSREEWLLEYRLLLAMIPAIISLGILIPEQFCPEIYDTLWPAVIVISAELPILLRFRFVQKHLYE